MLATSTLYNSAKLHKSPGYLECNGYKWDCREEMEDVFRKGKFELLALNETKLKGNEWRGIMVKLKKLGNM